MVINIIVEHSIPQSIALLSTSTAISQNVETALFRQNYRPILKLIANGHMYDDISFKERVT